MPDLSFVPVAASALKWAASPALALRIEITNRVADEAVHGVLLQCQVRIDAPDRRYSEGEEARLVELFGERSRWSRTLRSLLWTNASASVPAFTGKTELDLPLPCTFDTSLGATKYFAALERDAVPLALLFSGTVFFARADGAVQAAPVPWSTEARFELPLEVWQETLEHYYPNAAALQLRRDVFDRLRAFQIAKGLPTFDQAIETLLEGRAP
jgi:hypothetical protein